MCILTQVSMGLVYLNWFNLQHQPVPALTRFNFMYQLQVIGSQTGSEHRTVFVPSPGWAAVEMLLFCAFFSSVKTLKIPEKFSEWASVAQRWPGMHLGEAAPSPMPSIPLTAHHVLILMLFLKLFFAPSLTYTLSHSSLSSLIHQTLNNFLPQMSPLNSHICFFPLCWLGKIPIFQKGARACCTPSPWIPSLPPSLPKYFYKLCEILHPRRSPPLVILRMSVINLFMNLLGPSVTQDRHEKSV